MKIVASWCLCCVALALVVTGEKVVIVDVTTGRNFSGDGDQPQRRGISGDVMLSDSGSKVPCQPMPREVLQRIMGAAFNPRYMSIDPPEIDAETDSDGSSKFSQKDQASPKRPKQRIGAFHVHESFTQILYDEPLLVGRDHVTSTDDSYRFPVELPAVTARARHRNQRRRQRPRHRGTSRHNEQIDWSDFKASRLDQSEPTVAPSGVQHPPNPAEKQRHLATAADRFVRAVRSRRSVKSGFPWSCESKIEWLDLGPNHFPRFLRSVVCTSKQCWFGHFECRPKAFTVKVLRRRKDSCEPDGSITGVGDQDATVDGVRDYNAHVPDEFREQWVFQERAVTFCCECAG